MSDAASPRSGPKRRVAAGVRRLGRAQTAPLKTRLTFAPPSRNGHQQKFVAQVTGNRSRQD